MMRTRVLRLRFISNGNVRFLSAAVPSTSKNIDCKRLTHEIWNYYRTNTQSLEIYGWKMNIHQKLSEVLMMSTPSQLLIPAGSTVTGCATMYSDLDLCILPRNLNAAAQFPNAMTEKQAAVEQLTEFRKVVGVALGKDPNWLKLKVHALAIFRHAAVPILRIIGSRRGPEREFVYMESKGRKVLRERTVDINYGKYDCVQDSLLLHHYARWDRRFPVLSLVISSWADKVGVKDSPKGRLGGFSLSLLLLNFLQCGINPPVLPSLQKLYPDIFRDEVRTISELQNFAPLPNFENHKHKRPNGMSVGELLVEFFDYYRTLNFDQNIVSVREAGLLPRDLDFEQDLRYKRIAGFFIADPFAPHFNTAQQVHQIGNVKHIKDEFAKAYDALRERKRLQAIL